MSINTKLILLLSIVGIGTVACTKEKVDHFKEGQVTIVPLWEDYAGDYHPMEYYFYNVDKTAALPIFKEDLTAEGFTQTLPAGTYRLVGYNTDASQELSFDTSRNFTVVANFTSYPYSTEPLSLYIISADTIVVGDGAQTIKEIVPVEVKTKTLGLLFQVSDNIQVKALKGTLDGAFASIDLLNGKAIKDTGNIPFQASPGTVVQFRISDLYYSPNAKNDVDSPLYESMLYLTLDIEEKATDGSIIKRTKTGEVNLKKTIDQIMSYYNGIPNNILLYVGVENFSSYASEGRVSVSIKKFE
jgi:hypothetical protein